MDALNQRIKEKGYRKSYIAERIGLSNQAFSNKICGRTAFTIQEAKIMSSILDIPMDKFFYFFANDCENCE